jgi:8-oxo-dGTP pyrophosphatase MutT (NUDIX family)
LPVTGITLGKLREKLSARAAVRIAAPDAAEAAVALVVVPLPPDLRVLFIRRAESYGDPWSGHMALPGGRRHRDDADLAETARREAREEIGLDLSAIDVLGELDEVRPRSQAIAPIIVRPYVFGLSQSPVLTLSAEVAEWLWVPVTVLKEAHVQTEVDAHGTVLRVPAFVLGENVIWGLTERIVSDFIGLLANI